MDQSFKHLLFSLVFSAVVAALVLLALLAPGWSIKVAAAVAVAAFLWMIVRNPATFYRRMLHLLVGAVLVLGLPNLTVETRGAFQAFVERHSPDLLGAIFTGGGELGLSFGTVSPEMATILCVFAALMVLGDVAQQGIAGFMPRRPVAWLMARPDRCHSTKAKPQGVDDWDGRALLVLSNAEKEALIVTHHEVTLPGQLLGKPSEVTLSFCDPAEERELPTAMDGDQSLTVPPGQSRNIIVHFQVKPKPTGCVAAARRILRRPRRARITLTFGGQPPRRMSAECILDPVDGPLPPIVQSASRGSGVHVDEHHENAPQSKAEAEAMQADGEGRPVIVPDRIGHGPT